MTATITHPTTTTEHLTARHTMPDGTIYCTVVEILLGSDGLPDGRPMPYQGYAYVEVGYDYLDIIGQTLFDRCDRELAHHLYRLVIDHYCDSKEEPSGLNL